MKKTVAILLVLAMVFTMAACGKKEEEPTPAADIFAKGEGVMTYAEYEAAAVDSQVTIEAFVQACAYNAQYGNASLFLQDKDGGYYVYRMNVSADDAAKLVQGAKLKVIGYKSEWSGEVELTDATFEVLEGTYVAEAADATYDFYEEGLAKYPNQLVKVTGVQVEPSLDADGNAVPFLYNWDGSGAKGSNSDLYFNVSFHGNVFNLTVETDECPEGSDVYKAVEALKIGDTIDFESFIYWYNGPNPHVQKVTVTKAADAAVSADAFAAAAVDTEVIVEGYVTKAAYNEQYGNISFFMQDTQMGYYVYRMNVTPEEAAKIDTGVKVRVKGYKSEWSGEVEIIDATFEILDGEYKPAAYDITALLSNEEQLIKHMNKYVAFNNVTVAPSKNAAGEDVAYLYNWDGSGAAGSNCDLYFNVAVGDQIYNLTVESDECAEGSETYELATQMKIGDVVNLEGVLYWYNGANPHITKVLTK